MTLTIELESSELADATGDAGSAITNVRKFTNTVLVQDGQTVVVAGLIRDSKITGGTRVSLPEPDPADWRGLQDA